MVVSDVLYAAPVGSVTPAITAREALLQDPQRFEAPLDFSLLKDVRRGEKKTFIIHIQDAHSNLSGQQNLSGALDELMKRYGVSLVLVEGGTRDDSLTPLKKLAKPEVWKRVAKKFLMEGNISGEEYLNLTSERPMKIMGIEDKELYWESLRAYEKLATKREDALLQSKKLRNSLEKLKKKFYPRELMDYEKLGAGSWEMGDEKFEEKFEKLVTLAGQNEKTAQIVKSFPNIQALLKIKQKEKDIDFDAANLEQAALLEEMAKRGGSADIRAAVSKSSALKNNRLSQLNFFESILRGARERSISMERYPNLPVYEKYLESFRTLDFENLFDEFERLEDEVYRSVITNLASARQSDITDALLVRSIDRYAGLLDTAYRIQMSTKEFELFKLNEPDFATGSYLAFVNRKLADLGYFDDLLPMQDVFEEAKSALTDFYASVGRRDEAFMRNTERILSEEKQQVAVLIAGGYHTSNLKKMFAGKDYSYAVLAPIVTSETNQKKYEKVLLEPIRKELSTIETSTDSPRNSEKSLSALEEDLQTLKRRTDGIRAEAAAENGVRLAEMMNALPENPDKAETALTMMRGARLAAVAQTPTLDSSLSSRVWMAGTAILTAFSTDISRSSTAMSLSSILSSLAGIGWTISTTALNSLLRSSTSAATWLGVKPLSFLGLDMNGILILSPDSVKVPEKNAPRGARLAENSVETVRIILRDAEGRILLLQKNEASSQKGKWELPGGKVGKKEKPGMAAKRELKEEAGLTAIELEAVGKVEKTVTTVHGTRRVVVYKGRTVGESHVTLDKKGTHVAHRWVPLSELKNMHADLTPATALSFQTAFGGDLFDAGTQGARLASKAGLVLVGAGGKAVGRRAFQVQEGQRPLLELGPGEYIQSFDRLAGAGLVRVKGYLMKQAYVQVIWGQEWKARFRKRAGQSFVLDMEEGWPKRITFEDGSSEEFLAVRNARSGRILDVYTGTMYRDKFASFNNVVIENRIGPGGHLILGGGPPRPDGSYASGTKKWTRFTDKRFYGKKALVYASRGVVTRVEVPELGYGEDFTLVWSRTQNRFVTSFRGQLTAADFNLMTEDNEIIGLTLGKSGAVKLGGQTFMTLGVQYGGKKLDITDIRKIFGRTVLVSTSAKTLKQVYFARGKAGNGESFARGKLLNVYELSGPQIIRDGKLLDERGEPIPASVILAGHRVSSGGSVVIKDLLKVGGVLAPFAGAEIEMRADFVDGRHQVRYLRLVKDSLGALIGGAGGIVIDLDDPNIRQRIKEARLKHENKPVHLFINEAQEEFRRLARALSDDSLLMDSIVHAIERLTDLKGTGSMARLMVLEAIEDAPIKNTKAYFDRLWVTTGARLAGQKEALSNELMDAESKRIFVEADLLRRTLIQKFGLAQHYGPGMEGQQMEFRKKAIKVSEELFPQKDGLRYLRHGAEVVVFTSAQYPNLVFKLSKIGDPTVFSKQYADTLEAMRRYGGIPLDESKKIVDGWELFGLPGIAPTAFTAGGLIVQEKAEVSKKTNLSPTVGTDTLEEQMLKERIERIGGHYWDRNGLNQGMIDGEQVLFDLGSVSLTEYAERIMRLADKEEKTPSILTLASGGKFGREAAQVIAERIRSLQGFLKRDVNIIFATGKSQESMLRALARERGIDWSRVKAFHLAEYVGLDDTHPFSSAFFLKKNLFSRIPKIRAIPQENIYYINGQNADPAGYLKKLHDSGGADIALLGIGVNGHIGFNEPYTAFDSRMKEVSLSRETVEANVADHPGLADEQNQRAITMGVADIMESQEIYLLANSSSKKRAIFKALYGPTREDVPASVLRKHPHATFILSEDAEPVTLNEAQLEEVRNVAARYFGQEIKGHEEEMAAAPTPQQIIKLIIERLKTAYGKVREKHLEEGGKKEVVDEAEFEKRLERASTESVAWRDWSVPGTERRIVALEQAYTEALDEISLYEDESDRALINRMLSRYSGELIRVDNTPELKKDVKKMLQEKERVLRNALDEILYFKEREDQGLGLIMIVRLSDRKDMKWLGPIIKDRLLDLDVDALRALNWMIDSKKETKYKNDHDIRFAVKVRNRINEKISETHGAAPVGARLASVEDVDRLKKRIGLLAKRNNGSEDVVKKLVDEAGSFYDKPVIKNKNPDLYREALLNAIFQLEWGQDPSQVKAALYLPASRSVTASQFKHLAPWSQAKDAPRYLNEMYDKNLQVLAIPNEGDFEEDTRSLANYMNLILRLVHIRGVRGKDSRSLHLLMAAKLTDFILYAERKGFTGAQRMDINDPMLKEMLMVYSTLADRSHLGRVADTINSHVYRRLDPERYFSIISEKVKLLASALGDPFASEFLGELGAPDLLIGDLSDISERVTRQIENDFDRDGLVKFLKEHGVEGAEVSFRVKSDASVFEKMIRKGGQYGSAQDLSDLTGILITTSRKSIGDAIHALRMNFEGRMEMAEPDFKSDEEMHVDFRGNLLNRPGAANVALEAIVMTEERGREYRYGTIEKKSPYFTIVAHSQFRSDRRWWALWGEKRPLPRFRPSENLDDVFDSVEKRLYMLIHVRDERGRRILSKRVVELSNDATVADLLFSLDLSPDHIFNSGDKRSLSKTKLGAALKEIGIQMPNGQYPFLYVIKSQGQGSLRRWVKREEFDPNVLKMASSMLKYSEIKSGSRPLENIFLKEVFNKLLLIEKRKVKDGLYLKNEDGGYEMVVEEKRIQNLLGELDVFALDAGFTNREMLFRAIQQGWVTREKFFSEFSDYVSSRHQKLPSLNRASGARLAQDPLEELHAMIKTVFKFRNVTGEGRDTLLRLIYPADFSAEIKKNFEEQLAIVEEFSSNAAMHFTENEKKAIRRAYLLAFAAHQFYPIKSKNKHRRIGGLNIPYIVHPVGVAKRLVEDIAPLTRGTDAQVDVVAVVTALLHDVFEDTWLTETTRSELMGLLGAKDRKFLQVWDRVRDLSKNEKESNAQFYQRLLGSIEGDLSHDKNRYFQQLLIKLADKLDSTVRDSEEIRKHPEILDRKTAREVLDFLETRRDFTKLFVNFVYRTGFPEMRKASLYWHKAFHETEKIQRRRIEGKPFGPEILKKYPKQLTPARVVRLTDAPGKWEASSPRGSRKFWTREVEDMSREQWEGVWALARASYPPVMSADWLSSSKKFKSRVLRRGKKRVHAVVLFHKKTDGTETLGGVYLYDSARNNLEVIAVKEHLRGTGAARVLLEDFRDRFGGRSGRVRIATMPLSPEASPSDDGLGYFHVSVSGDLEKALNIGPTIRMDRVSGARLAAVPSLESLRAGIQDLSRSITHWHDHYAFKPDLKSRLLGIRNKINNLSYDSSTFEENLPQIKDQLVALSRITNFFSRKGNETNVNDHIKHEHLRVEGLRLNAENLMNKKRVSAKPKIDEAALRNELAANEIRLNEIYDELGKMIDRDEQVYRVARFRELGSGRDALVARQEEIKMILGVSGARLADAGPERVGVTMDEWMSSELRALFKKIISEKWNDFPEAQAPVTVRVTYEGGMDPQALLQLRPKKGRADHFRYKENGRTKYLYPVPEEGWTRNEKAGYMLDYLRDVRHPYESELSELWSKHSGSQNTFGKIMSIYHQNRQRVYIRSLVMNSPEQVYSIKVYSRGKLIVNTQAKALKNTDDTRAIQIRGPAGDWETVYETPEDRPIDKKVREEAHILGSERLMLMKFAAYTREIDPILKRIKLFTTLSTKAVKPRAKKSKEALEKIVAELAADSEKIVEMKSGLDRVILEQRKQIRLGLLDAETAMSLGQYSEAAKHLEDASKGLSAEIKRMLEIVERHERDISVLMRERDKRAGARLAELPSYEDIRSVSNLAMSGIGEDELKKAIPAVVATINTAREGLIGRLEMTYDRLFPDGRDKEMGLFETNARPVNEFLDVAVQHAEKEGSLKEIQFILAQAINAAEQGERHIRESAYDTRPVDAGLLSEPHALYDKRILSEVNPQGRSLVALYGAAGGDLVNLFLSVNPSEVFMVGRYPNLRAGDFESFLNDPSLKERLLSLRERLRPLNANSEAADEIIERSKNLNSAENSDPDALLLDYLVVKYHLGFGHQTRVDYKTDIFYAILAFELDAMGVPLDSVVVTEDEHKNMRISFPWSHDRGAETRRVVTFIDADVVKGFQKYLGEIRGNIDVYYQRAAMKIPFSYAEESDFLTAIKNRMSESGFFITDDHALYKKGVYGDFSGKFPESMVGVKRVDVRVPEAFKDSIRDMDGNFWTAGYGWEMTIRRRTDGARLAEKTVRGQGSGVREGRDGVRSANLEMVDEVFDGKSGVTDQGAKSPAVENFVMRNGQVDAASLGGFSSLLTRTFVHDLEAGENGFFNILADRGEGSSLADTTRDGRTFGDISRIFPFLNQNSKSHDASPYSKYNTSEQVLQPSGARLAARSETKEGGFGLKSGHLSADDLKYTYYLEEALKGSGLSAQESGAVINALIRMKLNSFKLRGRFFGREEYQAIIDRQPFNVNAFIEKLKVEKESYRGIASAKTDHPLLKDSEIFPVLFRKLVPYAWLRALLDDGLSKTDAIRILTRQTRPVFIWRRQLKPIRDELIRDGLSPTQAMRIVQHWSNPSEVWKELKPVLQDLVSSGLDKARATFIVTGWADPKKRLAVIAETVTNLIPHTGNRATPTQIRRLLIENAYPRAKVLLSTYYGIDRDELEILMKPLRDNDEYGQGARLAEKSVASSQVSVVREEQGKGDIRFAEFYGARLAPVVVLIPAGEFPMLLPMGGTPTMVGSISSAQLNEFAGGVRLAVDTKSENAKSAVQNLASQEMAEQLALEARQIRSFGNAVTELGISKDSLEGVIGIDMAQFNSESLPILKIAVSEIQTEYPNVQFYFMGSDAISGVSKDVWENEKDKRIVISGSALQDAGYVLTERAPEGHAHAARPILRYAVYLLSVRNSKEARGTDVPDNVLSGVNRLAGNPPGARLTGQHIVGFAKGLRTPELLAVAEAFKVRAMKWVDATIHDYLTALQAVGQSA